MTFDAWYTKNRGLVVHVANKYYSRANEHLMDDLFQEVAIGMFKGWNSHNPSKGKRSTWLAACGDSAALNMLSAQSAACRTPKSEVWIDHAVADDRLLAGDDSEAQTNLRLDLQKALSAVPEGDRAILVDALETLTNRIDKDSQKAVAIRHGVPYNRVRYLLRTWKPILAKRLAAYRGA